MPIHSGLNFLDTKPCGEKKKKPLKRVQCPCGSEGDAGNRGLGAQAASPV